VKPMDCALLDKGYVKVHLGVEGEDGRDGGKQLRRKVVDLRGRVVREARASSGDGDEYFSDSHPCCPTLDCHHKGLCHCPGDIATCWAAVANTDSTLEVRRDGFLELALDEALEQIDDCLVERGRSCRKQRSP